MRHKIIRPVALLLTAALIVLMSACAAKSAPKNVELLYSPGDYFTTNLSKSGTTVHLVRATLYLVVNDEVYLKALLSESNASELQPRIREAILFVLRNCTDTEILNGDEDNQVRLREKIVVAVNDAVRGRIDEGNIDDDEDYFVGVVFSDLVVQ